MQFSVPVPEGEDTRTIPKRRRKSGNLTTAQREARKAAKRAEEAAQAAEAGDAGESAISRAPVEVVEEDDRLPWEDRKALPPISPIPSSSPVPIPWSPSPPRGPAPAQSTGSGEYCLVVGRESSNKAGTKIVNGRTVKLTPVERKEEQHQLSLITGRRLKANTPARFRHIKAVFEKKRAHENARWDGRRCDKFFRAIREVLDAVPFG
ncbi:hypothetical protein BFW01_g5110 [Lasiodiplodia theobromae]|nr:hypothetical protein BFW01_g5110 [Lasiodiplodia theobromae]